MFEVTHTPFPRERFKSGCLCVILKKFVKITFFQGGGGYYLPKIGYIFTLSRRKKYTPLREKIIKLVFIFKIKQNKSFSLVINKEMKISILDGSSISIAQEWS